MKKFVAHALALSAAAVLALTAYTTGGAHAETHTVAAPADSLNWD
ncbi:hypothetical protein AB0N17_15015 [Streptomyces sp. NPDC051133]